MAIDTEESHDAQLPKPEASTAAGMAPTETEDEAGAANSDEVYKLKPLA